MELNSELLEQAVQQVQSLPGIGRKTAIRLVLSLLKREADDVTRFTQALDQMRRDIRYCKSCHNISDTEICGICQDERRNKQLICVVQDIRDVMALESTRSFNGLYHVLGGLISPIDGIGPSDLTIDALVDRIADTKPEEVILALSTTMEGETTTFLLYRKLQQLPVKVTTIARGVAFGGELEYADEITLGKSIMNRTPFEGLNAR